jgi:hypothetical protein
MRSRSTFLATNTAAARREEKRQFRQCRSIRKRAELLDPIEFGKKQRARSSKDGCTRLRYEYQGWAYVTDETSQHEVVRWQVSWSMACVFGKDPDSAENHSDGEKAENTRRGIQDGNGQADMLAEEQATQHIKAMLLKSSVKAGKIATHLNLQRVEAEEQEQEKREVQRVTEKDQATRSWGKVWAEAEAQEKADGEEKQVKKEADSESAGRR